MTTKRPQTHISIAVRGFNVKLPIHLGIEMRFWLGFALGKHPLQVSLCISKDPVSSWSKFGSSKLCNFSGQLHQVWKSKQSLTFSNISLAIPLPSVSWDPCCSHSQVNVNHFWAPNPYSAPCSLPLERMNHKPTCHFSGALSDLASSVQKSHEKDPTTNFYFLTISCPLQKLDPLCLWFLGNGRSGRWSLTELGVGALNLHPSPPELEHSNARRSRRIWATTATRPILGELLTSAALRFQRPGFEGYKTYLQSSD